MRHGTQAAIAEHRRKRERMCESCRTANVANKSHGYPKSQARKKRRTQLCSNCQAARTEARDGLCFKCRTRPVDTDVALIGGRWVYRRSVAHWVPDEDAA